MTKPEAPPSSQPPRLHSERVVLWTLAGILVVQFGYFLAGAAVRPTNNFASYYTASRIAAEGADVSRFYDEAWFVAQVQRFHPDLIDVYSPNPPTATLLLLPLAGLGYTNARVVWTVFSLLVLAAGLGGVVRALGFGGSWRPGLIALLLVYQPLYAHVAVGQAYAVLLGLLVAAWHGYRTGRPALLGLALGGMVVLKTAGVLLWLLLPAQRRWRALGWAVATALVVFLVTLPWLGLDAWTAYARALLAVRANPQYAVTAYQSLPGFFRHLLVYDPSWNPRPLFDLPALGAGLSLLGFVGLSGACVYAALKRRGRDDLVFGAFVIAGVVLSPASQDYQYVLLLLPLAIMVAWARAAAPALRVWIGLGVSLVLLANNLPHQSTRLAAGLVAVLAYPKLYGALLLWGLTLWACLRRDRSSTDLLLQQPAERPPDV